MTKNGLNQAIVCTGLEASFDFSQISPRGKHNDGYLLGAGLQANPLA
jgi:hypothetical protein